MNQRRMVQWTRATQTTHTEAPVASSTSPSRASARTRARRVAQSFASTCSSPTAPAIAAAYQFTTLPIAIGRGADVRDSRNQLLRINHVAFTEGDDDINRTVSRRHARIELDEATGRPRLIDDNSAQGTSIIRSGRGIAVPRGSRGLGLQTDDEIVLGQARVKIKIGRV